MTNELKTNYSSSFILTFVFLYVICKSSEYQSWGMSKTPRSSCGLLFKVLQCNSLAQHVRQYGTRYEIKWYHKIDSICKSDDPITKEWNINVCSILFQEQTLSEDVCQKYSNPPVDKCSQYCNETTWSKMCDRICNSTLWHDRCIEIGKNN